MEIFLVGTLWFWLLLAAATIFVIVSLEIEEWGGTGATITMIVLFAILYIFGGKEDLKTLGTFLIQNPKESILYILLYFGIGVVWSVIKWYFFLLNHRDNIKEKIENDTRVSDYDIPNAKEEKGRIISWMTYWVFSMIWTLINDPIKRAFKFIYNRIEGIFQSIADKMFADIKSQIKSKQKK